ncbi:MAG: shikimate dehydrogenase [Actinomycetota bacterium]|nr:shikimate dehydrogenase [Actinomycetota bacterium]
MRTISSQHFVGILGWPLESTLSPVMHNAAFRTLGIDWTYHAWPVPPGDLPAAVGGLRALSAMGANVTMPHKEAVVELLDGVSGDARMIGAVNTIQRVGDRLVGHNTDVDGFREFLDGDTGFKAPGKRALVLGAGGAARAVVRALDELGIAELTVAARNEQQAALLVPLASGGRARSIGWSDGVVSAGGFDLVVNATPVGMREGDRLDNIRLSATQVVVDLVYHAPSTPLLDAARAVGAQSWPGLGMLVRQAAASFQIWTGQDPPLETMSAVAVRELGSGRGADL